MLRIVTGLVALLVAGALHAQPKEGDSARARDHFRDGLAAVERADLDLALREFEAAYAARPHFSVLYNIGQARLGLGQPLQAVDAFERYLREAGELVPLARREEVVRLLAVARLRIGELRVVPAEPEHTRVWLDGVELAKARWARPIALLAGEHHVTYAVRAGEPNSRSVIVGRGESVELRLDKVVGPPALAELLVRCPVPGVEVQLAGAPSSITPLQQAVLAPAGATRVRFSRAGYLPSERTVTLDPSAPSLVDCALRPEPELKRELRAGLFVRATPADATIVVDGDVFVGGVLPVGPHVVAVQRDGFVTATQTVTLVSSRTLHHTVELQRTPAARVRFERARATRKVTGLALSGAGAALLVTAGGLFLWNNQRYRAWEARQATSSTAASIRSAVGLRSVDDLCIGLTVLGVGGGLAGSWLLATPPGDGT